MQTELDASHPELGIQILGVNGYGLQGGNDFITDGRDIPWLQDVDGNGDGLSDTWELWNVTYRDVFILDQNNVFVGAYNLTNNTLQIPENYAFLRDTLVGIAQVPEPATLTLLALGGVGVIARRKRRGLAAQ